MKLLEKEVLSTVFFNLHEYGFKNSRQNILHLMLDWIFGSDVQLIVSLPEFLYFLCLHRLWYRVKGFIEGYIMIACDFFNDITYSLICTIKYWQTSSIITFLQIQEKYTDLNFIRYQIRHATGVDMKIYN